MKGCGLGLGKLILLAIGRAEIEISEPVWFTTLIDQGSKTALSLFIMLETALAIFVLLIASIMGALLTVAAESGSGQESLLRAQDLWAFATRTGILLFLIAVAALSFRAGLFVGVACSIMAAA